MADLSLMAHCVPHIMKRFIMQSVLRNHVFLLFELVHLDHLKNFIIILLIILTINIARTIRLKAQMFQCRSLMYNIIVTHIYLDFSLWRGRTALCSYKNVILLFSVLCILLVLVRRDLLCYNDLQSVWFLLLFDKHLLILWIFHHSHRVILLSDLVIMIIRLL